MKLLTTIFLFFCATQIGLSGLHITFYHRDLMLVEDYRMIEVEEGSHSVRIEELFSGLFVSSLEVLPLTTKPIVSTKSLTLFPDNLNAEAILLESIGHWVSFLSGRERIEGKLLRISDSHLFVQPDTTFERVDLYERNSLGWLTFDRLSESSKGMSAVIWEYESSVTRKIQIKIRYLVKGGNWRAVHKLIRHNDVHGLLNTYFSIENTSFRSFMVDSITLVAGEPLLSTDAIENTSIFYPSIGGTHLSNTVDGYPIFTIQKPLTIHSRQDVLIPFMESIPVSISEKYVVESTQSIKPVVFREWSISPDLAIDQTLPWGEITFYRTTFGKEVFIGEGYCPQLNRGSSFDAKVGLISTTVVNRKQIQSKPTELGGKKETYTVEIYHSERKKVHYSIRERFYGNWEVTNVYGIHSAIHKKEINSTSIAFEFYLTEPRKEVIEYEITYYP